MVILSNIVTPSSIISNSGTTISRVPVYDSAGILLNYPHMKFPVSHFI